MAGEPVDPAPDNAPTMPSDDPKAFLDSANQSSGPARNAWIAFAGLIAFLLVTLAGVTHVDLLRNSPVTLPIVNVAIPLFSFFLFAPFLFLLVHLGLMVQHVMVANKYHHFTAALAAHGGGEDGNHPHRRLVHYYVFSQLLAGPRPPWALRLLMRLMVTFSLIVLPVLVLLYFQVKFLPSHDVAIIHAHRIAILLDLVLLLIAWPFVEPASSEVPVKGLSFDNQSWRWEIGPAGSVVAGLLFFFSVAFFSFAVATVPHGCDWPFGDQEEDCFSIDRKMAELWGVDVGSEVYPRHVFVPTRWLFEGEVIQASGMTTSLFSRNLVVTDEDLAVREDFEDGVTTLNLRGRDLKFAVLDRTALHGADLAFSDLRAISAVGSLLGNARLQSAQLQGADLRFARMRGATFEEAQLQGAGFGHAHMQDADFGRARMQGADFESAQMQGANLEEAQMQGADLTFAQMQGAYLGGAQMQAAKLSVAHMQGADLGGAQLQGANLLFAHMQGADFSFAQMQGADLSFAHMQGADLRGVQMQRADLSFAHLQGVDLRAAAIWQTGLPLESGLEMVLPMGEDDIAQPESVSALEDLITDTSDEKTRERLERRLGPLLESDVANRWSNSTARREWVALSKRYKPNNRELAKLLALQACSDESGGYIMNGIARRVLRKENEFLAEYAAARLVDNDNCAAAFDLRDEMRMELEERADVLQAKTEPKPRE